MSKKNEAKVTLKVGDNGTISGTKKKVDGLARSTDALRKGTDNVTKANKGVAKTSGKAGKDFSRVASGMGGLVAAYATVAANVFALSAAFQVLTKAADFDSMIISSQNLAAATGQSFLAVSKRVQEATKNQIDFADAMAVTNKALASGIDSSSLEQFTTLATKAAQTFGGSTTDALNRMTDAVLRGRTELVNKLGIVISADEAYSKFASGINKTVKELTSFEKRMAITQIIIEKGNDALGDTIIDANPFEVLFATFKDLSQSILSLGTSSKGLITSVLNTFNESATAVGIFASVIVASVFKKILPSQEDLINKLKRNAKRQKKIAEELVGVTERAENRKLEVAKKSSVKLDAISKHNISNIGKEIEAKTSIDIGKTNIKGTKSIQAAVSGKDLTPRQIKTLKLQVERELDGTKTALRSLNIPRKQLEKLLVQLKVANKETDGFKVKWALTQRAVGGSIEAIKSKITSMVVATRNAANAFSTTFNASKLDASNKGFLSLFTKLNGEGKKLPQVLGRVSAGFNKLLGSLGPIMFAIGIITVLWEKFGDRILGISPAQRRLNDAMDEATDTFEKYKRVLDEAGTSAETFVNKGLSGIAKRIMFSANVIKEATKVLGAANKVLNAEFSENDKKLKEQKDRLEALKLGIGEVTKEETSSANNINRALSSQQDGFKMQGLDSFKVTPLEFAIDKTEKEIKKFEDIKLRVNNSQLLSSMKALFGSIKDLGDKGLIDTASTLKSATSQLNKDSQEAASILKTLGISIADLADPKNLKVAVKALSKLGDVDARKLKTVLLAVEGSFSKVSETTSESGKVFKEAIETLDVYKRAQNNINVAFLSSKKAKDAFKAVQSLKNELLSLDNLQKGIKENTKDGIEFKAAIDLKQADLDSLAEDIKKEFGFEVDVRTGNAKKAIEELSKFLNDANAAFQSNRLLSDKLKILDIDKKINSIASSGIITEQHKVDLIEAQEKIDLKSLKTKRDNLDKKLKLQKGIIGKITSQSKESKTVEEGKLKVIEEQLALKDKEIARAKNLLKTKRAQAVLDTTIRNNALILDKLEEKAEKTAIDRLDILFKQSGSLDQIILKQAKQDRLAETSLDNRLQAAKNIRDAAVAVQDADSVKVTQAKLVFQQTQAQIKAEREVLALKRAGNSAALLNLSEGQNDFVSSLGVVFNDRITELNTLLNKSQQRFVEGLTTSLRKGIDSLLSGQGEPAKEMLTALQSWSNGFLGDLIENAILSSFGIESKEAIRLKLILEENRKNTAKNIEAMYDIAKKKAPESALPTKTALDAPNIFKDFPSFLSSAFSSVKDIISDIFSTPKFTPVSQESIRQDRAMSPVIDKVFNKEDNSGTSALLSSLDNLSKASGNQTAQVVTQIAQGITDTTAKVTLISSNLALTSAIIANTLALTTSGGSSILGGLFGGLAANGGVISSRGFTGLANGGLATQATPYLIGEGRKNEAVVPLPNNREIPVVMNNKQPEQQVVNNYDFSNADPASEARIRGMIQASGKATFSKVFSEIDKGGTYAKKSGRRR